MQENVNVLRWAPIFVTASALVAAVANAPVAGQSKKAAQPAALSGDEEAGREYYAEDCRACHSGAIAPTLKGVVGRGIASVPSYTYSAGLKAKAGKAWTAAELDAFLADPRSYAAGSKMVMKVEDAQKRADIIAYLKSM